MISVSAGLSSLCFYPFAHSINPFITERSFEQIKLDMCYNRFGGNIVSCGASFDYAWDGATHHAYTDLAILRLLPGLEVIQPGSCKELDILIRSQYNNGNTTYFRLSDYPHSIETEEIEFGKAVVLKNNNSKITVMTGGPVVENVFNACKDLDVNLIYFHTIKPVDKDVISAFKDTRIIVVHDAYGLYEALCEFPGISATSYGLPDEFCVWYGFVHDIRKQIGLDTSGIRERINRFIENKE